MKSHSKGFLISFIFLIFILSLVSAEFGYDNDNLPKLTRDAPTAITFNNNTGSVNSSDYWDNLDTPSDISIFLLNTGDTATGNYTFDTNTFFVDSVLNRIGINTTTPKNTLNVLGDGNFTGKITTGTITGSSGVNSNQLYYTDTTDGIFTGNWMDIISDGLLTFTAGTGIFHTTKFSLDAVNNRFILAVQDGFGVTNTITQTGTSTTFSKNVIITGDIQTTTANLAGMDISNDGTKTTFLGTAGDYNRIGDAGTTSHSLNSEDDLLVTGELEINGTTYFNGNIRITDNIRLGFFEGIVEMAYFKIETGFDDFRLAVGPGTGRQFLIVNTITTFGKDFDHAIQTNPTLFIHSVTDPDSDNTQWLSLTHDQTDGIIKTGKGDLVLQSFNDIILTPINGNVGIGTTTPQNALDVNGSINQTNGNLTGNMIHGSMAFHNDSIGNVTTLTEDVWANFTGFDQESNEQMLNGISYSNSILTIQIGGVYDLSFGTSFSGTVNNKYHVAIGINGVEQVFCESHDRISTGTDILSASFLCSKTLSVGDKIMLMYMNEDSAGDTTTLSAQLNLVRIGN